MPKLALGIEYDGSSYCGWQKQKGVSSIQECIENVLSIMTAESIRIYCAGRTDAGVHALGQVVHFNTLAKYPASAWVQGVNRRLPSNICIRWMNVVQDDFHARFSAISRRYCYIIYNACVRSSIFFGKVWNYKKLLDVHKMSKSANFLLGENDFSSFRSAGYQSSSSIRNIYSLQIIRRGNYIIIDVIANSFIYRMVRNIVGSLVEIGCGKRHESWITELLNSSNKSFVGVSAPAHGLYLMDVAYPEYFSIPSILVKEFWDNMFLF